MNKSKISYSSTGVDYSVMDPVKKLALKKALETSHNLKELGMKEMSTSRGETAFVWDQGDYLMTSVLECLGSKNLVADDVRKITGKTHYDVVAQDTVATAVNDTTAVGAKPLVVNAYFSLGDSNWLNDKERTNDLIEGWAKACNLSGAVWGGGETPTITGVTYPKKINLAASCVGIIEPKQRFTSNDKIKVGDVILLIESNGIHANGISLARMVAKSLTAGYATKLPNGQIYGDAILQPTHLYAKVVQDLFESGVEIHYLVNITGHGWRKLMRANKDFTYLITQIPPIPPIFDFIQEKSGADNKEMYGTFNMGAGFAILLPQSEVKKAQEVINKHNLKSWEAGVVESGPKKVVIKPKNLTFEAESLAVR